MFKFINKIFLKEFIKNNGTLLGRFNHLTCEKQITNRVRQANEDHCGVCVKNYSEKKTKNHSKNDDKYLEYFKWTSNTAFYKRLHLCQLCRKLNHPIKFHKIYKRIDNKRKIIFVQNRKIKRALYQVFIVNGI